MNRINTHKIKRKRIKIKSKKGGTYESYLATSTYARNPSRLTAQRASRVIQRALHKSVKKSKIKAVTRKNASKKIQRRIRRSFDFEADDCAICLEKKFVRSKVTPLSCHSKHGLHTKCFDDLLKKNLNKCPQCRAPMVEGPENLHKVAVVAPTEQDLENLNNNVRQFINNNIRLIPRDLNTPDNIENLNLFSIDDIIHNAINIRNDDEVLSLMHIIIFNLSKIWEGLDAQLYRCNIAGIFKKNLDDLDDSILISVRDNFLTKVLAYQRLLSEFGMELPNRQITQIQKIRDALNRNANIGQPVDALIQSIYDSVNVRIPIMGNRLQY